MDEEWRPVVGMESLYEVSSIGRVRSKDHVTHTRNRWGPTIASFKGKMLHINIPRGHYAQVTLSENGVSYQRTVHSLVADAFIGPRPEGLWVLHKDDDKRNPCVGNLYHGTVSQNRDDCRTNGSMLFGESHPGSKLTDDAVIDIISHIGKKTQLELATKYGVSKSCVGWVVRGETWTHIPRSSPSAPT